MAGDRYPEGRDLIVTSLAYLDFNATAPARPEVIETVAAALRAVGNASSVHAAGRAARARVEEARRQVAALVGADPDGVVFTGSGTEANNQALRCAGCSAAVVSAIEHESVLLARGDAVTLPVGPDGIVDLAALERILGDMEGPAIVSVMAANNETGILQPVDEVVRLAHAGGAVVHCDAVQAAGKVPFDLEATGADFVSLSAHKLGGPQGVGALVCRDRRRVERLIHGGGQEGGLRAGTENVAGIAGFGAAAECAAAGLSDFAALAALRDALERRLSGIAPEIVVFGTGCERLPNTSKLATPGLSSELQVMGLDLAGIAISAGSACSAGRIEPPYVLSAMGVDPTLATCAVRVSLGWTTTAAEIDRLVSAWEALYRRARGRSAAAE